MKNWERLISEDMTQVAQVLDDFLKTKGLGSYRRDQALTACRYYEADHDIKKSRIFYLDEHDKLVEDKYAANVKIPHAFFMELVDQKVQYMLSGGIEITSEKPELQTELDEYIDSDFKLFINDILEGVSIKGVEYSYARTDSSDRLRFQVSDSLTTVTVLDDDNNEVAVIRSYEKRIPQKSLKDKIITYAEVYTADDIRFFVRNGQKAKFVLDDNHPINPQAHVIAIDNNDGSLLERSYGRIPFYRLTNNRSETSDLLPIKELIDDYDRMASFLSNNLEDYDRPIYVVSGYQGESLDKLRQNLKTRSIVKTGAPNTSGGVEVKTYQIPYEARKAKMEIDKEAIYKFGMGFNSSQVGDGNVTNIVIKSRYSLLELKCNKLEPRLRALLDWCIDLILTDIERRGKGKFSSTDVEINLDREMLINETDTANRELVEAQTKQALINVVVLSAPYIDEESILMKVCEYLDLDFDEVTEAMEEQSTGPFVNESELIDNDESEQMAEGSSKT